MKQAGKLKGEFSFCAEKHYGGAVSMLGERPNGSTNARFLIPTKFLGLFFRMKFRGGPIMHAGYVCGQGSHYFHVA